MLNVRIAKNAASRASSLLRAIQYTRLPDCPCHASPGNHQHGSALLNHAKRSLATPIDQSHRKEYAFEMAASSIRFGPGCTKEVGMDFKNLGSRRVCVVTDGNVAKLDAMKQVVEGLSREQVEFTVFQDVKVEPKDSSIKEAVDFAKSYGPDAFLAVGGGSVSLPWFRWYGHSHGYCRSSTLPNL